MVFPVVTLCLGLAGVLLAGVKAAVPDPQGLAGQCGRLSRSAVAPAVSTSVMPDLGVRVAGLAEGPGLVGTPWWEALSRKDWGAAEALAVEQGAAALPLLLDAIAEEAKSKEASDLPAGVEPVPTVFRKLALSAKWERWLLSAAYSGVQPEAATAVLALLSETAGTASRQALARDVASLRSGLHLDEDPESPVAWVRLETGANLEQAHFARKDPSGSNPNVICGKGRYRLRENLVVPKGVELWIERGSIINPSKGVKLVLQGSLRVFGAGRDPVQLGVRAQWAGLKQASEAGILSDLVIQAAEVGIEMSNRNLYLHNSIIRGCEVGIDNWAGNVWCDDVLCEGCSVSGVTMRTNGGHWSFLTNCTFSRNERGVSLLERHRLAVWNCVFRSNKEFAVDTNAMATDLRVVNCNFEKAPLRFYAEKPFDISGNWWKAPNPSRAIRYVGGAGKGQVQFVPPLKKKVGDIGYRPVDVK